METSSAKFIVQFQLTPAGDRPDSIFLEKVNGVTLAATVLARVAAAVQPANVVLLVSPGNWQNQEFRQAVEPFGCAVKIAGNDGIIAAMTAIMHEAMADHFIRIIGNNPLIDFSLIAAARQELSRRNGDYLTFAAPQGLAPAEIIASSALAKCAPAADWPAYLRTSRDLFTLSYFSRRPDLFRHVRFVPPGEPCPDVSLSVTDRESLLRLSPYFGKQAELAALAASQPEQMTFAQIEPAAICNLACTMCARTTRRKTGLMSLAACVTILDRLPHLRRVNFNGDGEPLLNPELPEFLAAARARGIMTRTITNANVTLPADRLEKLVAHLDILHISCDGATAATYEKIRLGGNFIAALNNIRQLAALVRQRTCGLDQFWLNFVVQHGNFAEVVAMVELAARLGVPAVNFKLVNSNWDRGTDTPLAPDQEALRRQITAAQAIAPGRLSAVLAAARERGSELGVAVWLEKDINRDFSYARCGAMKHIFITYDGEVTPCCLRADPDVFSFGNLLRQPAADIFNSDKYQAFKRALRDNRPPALCRRCPSLETLRQHHPVPDPGK